MRELRISTDKVTRRGARIGEVQLEDMASEPAALLEPVN
jgi:hypothetical protein